MQKTSTHTKIRTFVLAVALTLAAVALVNPRLVAAETTAEQEQKQSAEWECKLSGAYNGETVCTAKMSQDQKQKIILDERKCPLADQIRLPDGRVICKFRANTSLPTADRVAILAVALAGIAAAFAFARRVASQ